MGGDMADITFSFDDEQTEAIFTASTPKGEEWLGSPEERVPLGSAKEYREAAEAEGLVVQNFP